MSKLYFVARKDLSEGRRAAQLIHAMDQWSAKYGPQLGTVVVYETPDEGRLLDLYARLDHSAKSVLWREPDLDNQATAFATTQGPMKISLLRGQV